MNSSLFLLVLCSVVACESALPKQEASVRTEIAARPARERPNVLFIAIDDLNDWIGVLGGHPQARTHIQHYRSVS